jgi:hypothetical protein
MENHAKSTGWPPSRIFGVIGGFGMAIFFGILVFNDGELNWASLPSGVAMWVGYPLSWYFERRERRARGDL